LTVISKDVEIALGVEELNIARFQESAPATFSVTAYPGEQFRGLVTSVFPSGDTRSRTFTVKVRPEDQEGRLRPGMFAQLSVELERRENVNTVPRDAIVLRNEKPYTFVVAENVAGLRPVDLGLQDDRRAEVKSGLQTGEDVVISGQATLRDKEMVRIIPAGGQRQGAAGAAQGAAGAAQGAAGQGQGATGAAQGGQRPAGTPGAAGAAGGTPGAGGAAAPRQP
jgi:membrane fusion protein (multidrug efflux system)